DICDIRQTRQLLPQSCDALDRLAAAIRSLGAESVREIELAENLDGSDRVVALDAVAPIDPRSAERLGATDGLTGLVAGAVVRGSSRVTDRLTLGDRHVQLQRHVLAFFQGNRHLLRDLASHVAAQAPADGDVVDPPRTGMSREALDGAIGLGARRMVYVSCDVATLARDARRIVDGGFRISRADAFDLFPNTPHVETVVTFDR